MEKNNGVLNLLKRRKRGFLGALFSRAWLIAVMLVLQFGLLFVVEYYFIRFLPHYYVLLTAFSIAMVIYLFNSRADPSSKLTWLAVIMIVPVFGALLLLYTRSDVGHRMLRDRYGAMVDSTHDLLKSDEATESRFAAQAPEAVGLSRYLARTGCHPIYGDTEVSYFPTGEDKFKELLIQLEAAEKYIYLEYFIIVEGLMWGSVLDVLARKAAQGVDVRLMYDGTCEFKYLPHNYPKRLEKLGIKCRAFAPMTPFVSTYYNYRDHRKIVVIDGKVAFTGGVNLADEYINEDSRFGHWKDTAVMLRGGAARSFELMFLQMWNMDTKTPDMELGELSAECGERQGFVIPYGDCPLDDERVGEWVYMDILNRAQSYVYIMTPYLILDGEMETALRFAAEKGVDVRLLLPGIPDKKLPYALAKTHYSSLLQSGVKIYEYTPGFVHAKVCIADDKEAVVGTINLDYRSLYHHFECAAYMYGVPCIENIKRDYFDTESRCRRVDMESVKKEKWTMKLAGFVMKIIAPLL